MANRERRPAPDGTQQVEMHSRGGEYFGAIAARVIARRTLLKGSAAAATLLVAPATAAAVWGKGNGEGADSPPGSGSNPGARLQFQAIPDARAGGGEVVVAPGYRYQVLLTWGTPISSRAPEFDVERQTRQSQEQQVGFNHDLVLFYPLPRFVRENVARAGHLPEFADRWIGLLYPRLKREPTRNALVCINHEYTSGADMFPDYDPSAPTRDQVEVEIAAHGATIAELAQQGDGSWRFVQDSPFNRRITGYTEMEISGPLRGHDALKTADEPTGTRVVGMFNNCAGGKTPWGTILTCEENFDQYFANFARAARENRARSARIPAPAGPSFRGWERYDARFDLAADSNQYNKYGYVVEIDPYDPSFVPRKRTALGRFKHEGAMGVETRDGRVAIYSGDDARFEYVYKFVSRGRYDRSNRAANRDLLDDGVLYVARFDGDGDETENGQNMGTGQWLPLVWEPGNALDEAGFDSQAEVLLNTRGAADALGATPMDRPEDVDVSPVTGKVYVALTNNSRRTERINAANPRKPNQNGHVIELIEDGDDAGALTFRWNIFILCGVPGERGTAFGTVADPVAAGVSTVSDPDNLVIDRDGNLWIATDGMPGGVFVDEDRLIADGALNDGVFAVPTEGPDRGLLKRFFAGVPGCEVCGPEFSSDERTFFCAIQHPRDGEAFSTPWPAGEPVAKPALVAVRHELGQKIGR